MQAEKFVLYALTNYGVSFTKKEAQAVRDAYFTEFRGLELWHREVLSAKGRGIARTIAGRLRYLDPELAHNEFLNHPVQGAGADGLKTALREIYFRLKKFGGAVKMVHHVHDEIITETDDNPELCAAVSHELKEGMECAMGTIMRTIPVVVDPSTGDSWAEK